MIFFILFLVLGWTLASLTKDWQQRRYQPGLQHDWTFPYLLVVLVVMLVAMAGRVVDSAYFIWNDVRVAPALALRLGINIYPAIDSGTITGHIYGPIAALVYVPATFFTDPDTVIRTGSVLTYVMLLVPVVMWSRTVSGGLPLANALRGLVAFWLLTRLLPSLDCVLYNIHADTPALFFGGLAGYLAFCRRREAGWAGWVLPAFLAALSVWTKQTMAPLLIALPLCVWWLSGRLPALRCTLLIMGCTCLAAGVFIVWFGWDRLWLDLFRVPSAHPWVVNILLPTIRLVKPGDLAGRLLAACWSTAGLAKEALLPGVFFGVVAVFRRFKGAAKMSSEGFAAIRFLLGLAVAHAPTAILGRVKYGGSDNAFSYCTYFLGLALVIYVLETWNQYERQFFLRDGRLRQAASLLALAAISLAALHESVFLVIAANRPVSTGKQVVAYLREHPGEAYFPWHPLEHLMVDRRYYHFSYGVKDWILAGLSVAPGHRRDGLPAHLREIYVDPWTVFEERGQYVRFIEQAPGPELNGWSRYVPPKEGN